MNGSPQAIEDFQAALREDPYFAEAWSALAETYTGAGITQWMPIDAAIKQARTAALRAIELDPQLASGHAAIGSENGPAAQGSLLRRSHAAAIQAGALSLRAQNISGPDASTFFGSKQCLALASALKSSP